MIKSMTGYGTASFSGESLEVTVEIKTLNSKFLDAIIRLPRSFSDREIEVRNLLSEVLERGKVAFNAEIVSLSDTNPKVEYNEELFLAYFNRLKHLSDKVGAGTDDVFRTALQAPDVAMPISERKAGEDEWKTVLEVVQQAIAKCNSFREQEGEVLKKKLDSYINEIGANLEEIEKLDPVRVDKIKARIKNNLEEFIEEEKIDKNRFEQELIYFIEKLDISEEKVRLKAHLTYFKEALASEKSNGKKLGFISQEIGREINTIGSKANDAHIQKYVVAMKEELEKIKEQALNIL